MPAQPFFQVPTVEDNEDGWGPTTVPQQLEGIPYAPFSKGEKVSKISDFTGSGFNRFGGRGRDQGQGVAVFNFFHNEEEDSFHLVDNKPAAKNKGQRRFNPQRFAHRNTQFSRGQPEQPHQARQKQQKQRQFQNFHRDNQRQVTYSSSVDIRPEWPVVESIPFTSLAKLNFTVGKPEDIAFCGALEYYDKVYDRVTPKVDRPLKRTNKVFKSVTTSDDPIIRKLASEDKAQVFMTDVLLTSLMCAPRSVYSWDIVVTRAGDKLFFDKRDGSNLDYLTVAEQRLEALRDAQAGTTAAAPVPAAKGKPAKPDPKGGKAPLKPDLPKRLAPLPDLFPTHVIHLDAPEPALLPRCLALGERELAAARAAAAAAAAAEGKPAAAPAKGKAKEPAGPMTHNTDKDFKRRYAAYKASHEGDAASLKALQAAEQLWWDDKRILLEVAAAAEADATAAASAKTLRLTALATMKSMGPGGFAASLAAPSRHGSAFLTARSRNASVTSLMPGESAGNMRKRSGSPSPDLPAAAALAAHLKAGVLPLQHGGLLGLFAKHHAQVLVVDTSLPTGLDGVAASVTSLVGPPHNYTASDSRPENSQPADDSSPAGAPAATAAGDAVDHATDQAAVESRPVQLTAEEAAQEEHVQRCRAETVAMRAEPMKRYLMQQLMPVLAKAMVEATEEQAADPVQFVAHKLLEAGKLLDLQYVDPYAADIYDVQQQKWNAKQKREADRQAVVAARATSASA